MFRFLFLFFISSLILTGCTNKDTDEESLRYHDDGRSKPVATITPIIETASASLPWNLSEELTSILKTKISNRIFVEETSGYLAINNDPFSTNINWVKDKYDRAEFAVFVELVEYDKIPLVSSKNPTKIPESRRDAVTLNMGARVRIIDVRKSTPIIVLQEMIRHSYYMPNGIDNPNYDIVPFGTEEYKTTPLALAHTQFIKQVAVRVNEYILLAKER